jgi:hypothetical protein
MARQLISLGRRRPWSGWADYLPWSASPGEHGKGYRQCAYGPIGRLRGRPRVRRGP